MKKMFRFLCLVLAAVITFANVTVISSAKDEPQGRNQAVEALVGLKILEAYDEADGGLDKVVQIDEFALIVTRILGIKPLIGEEFKDSGGGDPVEVCRSMGLFWEPGGQLLEHEDPLTYQQAVKVLVTALGYDMMAENNGGFPSGYFLIANRLRLTENVAAAADQILRRSIVSRLVYNALHIDIADETSFGKNQKKVISRGITLLSKIGIETGAGIITATPRSRLAGISDLSKSTVEIDEVIFELGDTNAKDYLGYDVTYYSKTVEGENTKRLIYIAESKKNNYVTVSAEKILKDDFSFSAAEFAYEEEGKRKHLKISKYADLIYNGVSIGSFTASDMCPKKGFTKLLDNDGDDVYDVIFVTEYEIVSVGSIGGEQTTVVDSYDADRIIHLTPQDREFEVIVSKDGQKAQLASIQRNNILSIAKSKNTQGLMVIEVVISDDEITGVLTEKTDGNKLLIDGVEYRIADNLMPKINDLILGMTGKFYLSSNGIIAGFEQVLQSEVNYAYLISASVAGGLSPQCSFKLFLSNGSAEYFTGAKKIILDGEPIADANDVIKILTDSNNGDIQQLIRFNTNKQGEINIIDTKVRGEKEGDDTLTMNLPAIERRYMSAGYAFGDSNPEILVNNKVIVFLTPTEAYKNDETKYSIAQMSYFVGSGYYTFEVYDMTEDMYAGVMVIKEAKAAEIQDDTNISQVISITDAVDESGEVRRKLTVYQRGNILSLFAKDNAYVEGLTFGQFIRIGTDANGYIDNVARLLDPKEEGPKVVGAGANPLKFFSTWRIACGMLMDLQQNTAILSIDPESPERLPYYVGPSRRVTIFNYKRNLFSRGTIADIQNYIYGRNPNARVAIITSFGGVMDVVLMDFGE